MSSKGGTSGNSAVGNCAVMRNPFSTAVANPRIPDGRATLSCAQRYSTSRSLETITGRINILLYPGFHCGLQCQAGPSDAMVQQPNFGVYDSKLNRKLTPVATMDQAATTVSFKSDDMNPNRWRVVSQGLRVTLINNALDNDGWWEAVRIGYSGSPNDHVINNPKATANTDAFTTATDIAMIPAMSTFENGMITDPVDWSADPSYMAGKLRDIGKFNFCLHRIGDADFVQVPDVSTIVKNATTAGTGIVNNSPILRNANEMSYWQDRNMDCILIRIRANAPTEGIPGGRLQVHMHMIQHVEEMYDPKSMLHRFMSIPPRNIKLTEDTEYAIKRNIKAGTLRAQTGGVSITS